MKRDVTGFEVFGQAVTYMTTKDLALVYRAMTRSEWDHRGQTRSERVNGRRKAYYTHPVAVAAFLAKRRCDAETLAAAFLHDVVEDVEGVSLADIETEFGPVVARLVDGVTKVKHPDQQTTCMTCTKNKVAAAISEDVRVLWIKLADRYHNLQTLRHMGNLIKERGKVDEALAVYVPLAREHHLTDLAADLEALAYRELERIERAGAQDGKG